MLADGAQVTAVQPGHVLKMEIGEPARPCQQRHLQPALSAPEILERGVQRKRHSIEGRQGGLPVAS
jgi:hypothetical protein